MIIRGNMKKGFKKWCFRCLFIILLTGILIPIFCHSLIKISTHNATFNDPALIPYCKVGLLLGTSPRLKSGKPNAYFNYRIDAAVALYKRGKISRILVSGDNRRSTYNEPAEIRKALRSRGIPDSAIISDYAGFRTLDSVIRARKVFGQDSVTIISQPFHNERAIYIARFHGIHALGFNARDVEATTGIRTQIREYLARVKVFLDLWTDKAPHHLGTPILIP